VKDSKTMGDIRQELDEMYARGVFAFELSNEENANPDEVHNALANCLSDIEYLFKLLPEHLLPLDPDHLFYQETVGK